MSRSLNTITTFRCNFPYLVAPLCGFSSSSFRNETTDMVPPYTNLTTLRVDFFIKVVLLRSLNIVALLDSSQTYSLPIPSQLLSLALLYTAVSYTARIPLSSQLVRTKIVCDKQNTKYTTVNTYR